MLVRKFNTIDSYLYQIAIALLCLFGLSSASAQESYVACVERLTQEAQKDTRLMSQLPVNITTQCSVSSAASEKPKLDDPSFRGTVLENVNGKVRRCISDLGGVKNKRCWKVQSTIATELDNPDSNVKIGKITVEEMGVSPQTKSMVVGIKWESETSTMSLSTPEGRIFAILEISEDGTARVSDFVDESFTEEFDRSEAFSTTGEELKTNTLKWLNLLLVPYIEEYLKTSGTIIPLPLK